MYINFVIAIVLGYAVTSASYGTGTEFVSLHMLMNDKELLLTFAITFLASMVLGTFVDSLRKNHKRYKAAMSIRRHPSLHKHVVRGVSQGNFAYLANEEQYGTEDKLPPMTVVYVVSVSDVGEVPMAQVVPKFVEESLPILPIQVPLSSLYQHVPRHMIPEIV